LRRTGSGAFRLDDAVTLENLEKLDDRPDLLSLAVFFGKTRLIDNVVLEKAKKLEAAGAGS
jgi:pantothenate synthetase